MRKRVVLIACVALLTATSAAAAWIVYSGSSGSAAGSFAQSTNGGSAITFATGTGTATAAVPCTAGTGATCTGGTPGVIPVAITNNDQNNEHAATGVTVTLSSSPLCNSHVFLVSTSNLTESVPAGTTEQNGSVTFVADPSTTNACSGTTVTATISGGSS